MTDAERKRRVARAIFYVVRMNPCGRTWSQLSKTEQGRYTWLAEAITEACGSFAASTIMDRLEAIARSLR